MPTAEILSQGDEVVTGQIVDTNAAWLAEQLVGLGFDVVGHSTVGDRLDDLVRVLGEIGARADVCIGTGGLGPTDDDLTAEAVAKAFDAPLVFDEEAMRQIEELFRRFQRTMAEVNRKQAWLPKGSWRLDNSWGTAPGFATHGGRCWFAFLPGVPREMKPMFETRVVPLLRERFALQRGRLVTLRTTGVGESDLQQRIGKVSDPRFVLGYRTVLPENHVKLRFHADVPEDEIRQVTAGMAEKLGSPVFSIEGIDGLDRPAGSLPEVVGRALAARGETVAVAESCTGGRIAAQFTGIAGSSNWFLEGLVTYANAAKVRLLGVPPAMLDQHGAVSEPVATTMAAGVRVRSGATWGLAATGIAGPGGGSAEKPVGTVHIAISGPEVSLHRRLKLGGDRERIQTLAAYSCIDLLRRHLQNVL